MSARRSRRLLAAVCALSTVATATACSVQDKDSSSSSGKAQTSSGRSKISVITVAGPLSDPFWSAFAKGTSQAFADLGIQHSYKAAPNFDNIVPDTAKALQAAIAQKPDALVVGDFFPDSEEPLIKQAIAAGIPTVIVNSGHTAWQKLGAVGFVGEDPELVGEQAGEQMVKAGKKTGICVNTIPDNPDVAQRCAGFIKAMKAGGSTASTLNLASSNNTDPSAIQNSILGSLRSNTSIDAVYTIAVTVAGPALKAIDAAGRKDKIALGTSDIGTDVLNDIKAGSMLFAVDQQPYLQGYYGVLMATQSVQYGLRPATAITSGPLVVTKSNVQQVIDTASAGVRGAA